MNFILFLGILLVLGLASTRLMKIFHLPNVTGYLIIGVIAALLCLLLDSMEVVSINNQTFEEALTGMNSFVSSIALGFIALSIGEEFKLSKIKAFGKKIVIITIIQALATLLIVDIALFVACKFLGLSVSIAIVLGAIATATAPAATIMVINQYKAKGPLVDILLPVVAFDDAIGLVAFSISVALAKAIAMPSASITFTSLVLLPLLDIFGSIIVGLVLGYLMHAVIKFFKSRNNHAIVIIAFTLIGVGICEAMNTIKIAGETLEFSNLLCCMMIGAFYINFAKHNEESIINRDVELIDRWTPFLFMLFFILSGAHLVLSAKSIFTNNTASITNLIIVFFTYLVFRSLGKYFGAYFGSSLTKQQSTIKKYLGLTLLPQAGVAIGMANSISRMSEFNESGYGSIIVTCVLLATLVYELFGPLVTKLALKKAHEIPDLED